MSLNLNHFKHFTEHHYARHLVLRTDNLEILVVCWMPGQLTPFHGHGPTDGVVVMLEGCMQNTNIMPDGKRITQVFEAGDIIHSPVGTTHRMANTSDDPAISLHLYAPPLGEEYKNPDLGYANDIETQEMQLPDEVRRFVMARPQVLDALTCDSYSI